MEDLCLRFGGLTVLDEVSLQVPAGSITALIGPNGAGKTSLFNAVSGCYRPQAGTHHVRRGGRHPPAAARGVPRWAWRARFRTSRCFGGMTVLDNIKLGGHVHLRAGVPAAGLYAGRARREERRLQSEIEGGLAELVGIADDLHVPASTLAYGLQKRVELARALALRPRLLLLDEPVAGMNRREREEMVDLIRELRRRRGATILLVEHDMSVVMDISDQVVVLDFGRVIAAGTPAAVRDDRAVIAAYLGTGAERS